MGAPRLQGSGCWASLQATSAESSTLAHSALAWKGLPGRQRRQASWGRAELGFATTVYSEACWDRRPMLMAALRRHVHTAAASELAGGCCWARTGNSSRGWAP